MSIDKDYPASEIGELTYFRGTNLVMILIGDPDTNYIRYVTVYQMSPPGKVAEWDVGSNAQIICEYVFAFEASMTKLRGQSRCEGSMGRSRR